MVYLSNQEMFQHFNSWNTTTSRCDQYQRQQELRIQQIQRQERIHQESLSRQADRLFCAERARTDAVSRRMGFPTDKSVLPEPPPLSESPRFSDRFTCVNRRHNSPRSDSSLTLLSSLSSVDSHTPRELMMVYPFTPELTPPPSPPKTKASRLPVLQKRLQSEPVKANVSNGQSQSIQHTSCTLPKQLLPLPQAPTMVPKPPTDPRPQAQKARSGRTLRPAQGDWQGKGNTKCALEMLPQAPAVVCTPLTGPTPKTKKICPGKILRPAQKQEKPKERKQDTASVYRPLDNPAKSLKLAFEWLESDDWLKKTDGLKTFQILVRYHKSTMLPKLHDICLVIMEEIKNLRSNVACAAINTMADLYFYLKSTINPEVERTCRSLLLRLAQDTSAFIHEQVNLALDALVENCNHKRVVTALLNTAMSNRCVAVRASAAEHLKQVLDKVGADAIFSSEKGFIERFLIAISKIVVDAAPGVRCFGVQILQDIALHRDFLSLWDNNVPERDRRPLDKIFKKLKNH